jgi:hypothetical protein
LGNYVGVIVDDAVEQSVTVEVGMLEPAYAGRARSLALSLGAQQVHVYPKPTTATTIDEPERNKRK